MDEQLAQILLQEFRAFRDSEFSGFRAELAAWRQEAGERVTVLETQMKDLYGNGREGRVTTVEKKLSKHDKLIWTSGGVLLVIQTWLGIASEWHLWPWKK